MHVEEKKAKATPGLLFRVSLSIHIAVHSYYGTVVAAAMLNYMNLRIFLIL